MISLSASSRVFKTSWFAKAARKALIHDAELCKAIAEAMRGQADDLGGGVYKKRLDKNRYRSIILANGGRLWVFEYIFAKKDRANIDDVELLAFRALSEAYSTLSAAQIDDLLRHGDMLEICHDKT